MTVSVQNVLVLSAILGGCLPSASWLTSARSPNPLPFKFTYPFTATLKGDNPSTPIFIPSGILVTGRAWTTATIDGPSLNGTIQGGFDHPSIYGKLQLPSVDVYGMSSDVKLFYLHGAGIGSRTAKVARLELNINGTQYMLLNNGYILVSIDRNANSSVVTVKGYLVEPTVAD